MKKTCDTNEAALTIAELVRDVHDLCQGEQCDHSVGICWCEPRHHIRKGARWLIEHGYAYLCLDICKEVTRLDKADQDRLC